MGNKMQRLVIIHNSHSSKAGVVNAEVLEPARHLQGYMVGKFEVYGATVAENSQNLAKVLKDGDIVVTAGGDGTTEVGINGIMLSGKDVRLGILGYGNFNDVARIFGLKELGDILQAKTVEAYPLECLVNGKHLQYTMGYFTAGMMAEAAQMLNRGEKRKHLRKNKKNTLFALRSAVAWYLKNKQREFLPGVVVNGKNLGNQTEYLAINSGTVAKVMKTPAAWHNQKEFHSGIKDLSHFWKMVGFGLGSIIFGMKLKETRGDKITFAQPANFILQSEGECVALKNVETLEVRKAATPIKVFKI